MSTRQQPVSATIAGELAAAAGQCPDDVAIVCEGEQRTFAEYQRDVWAAARGLAGCGIVPGDRVALWAPNTLDAAVALLAVVVAGGTAVPLNTRYQSQEMIRILGLAQCRMVIAPASFLGRELAAEAVHLAVGASVVSLGRRDVAGARSWPQLLASGAGVSGELEDRIRAQSGQDVAVLQYTSGTTGRPRGVLLRQGPMLATAAVWSAIAGLGRQDSYPVAYPFAHVGGYKTGLLSTLTARATALLFPAVTTETLVTAVCAHNPAVINGPPPVLRSLLAAAAGGKLPAGTRIRTVVTGSSMVPPLLVRELADVLGVADVINAYGLTEATGVCMMTRRGDPVSLVCETVGKAIDGVQVRIASAAGQPAGTGEIGEIEVRGPNVMAGYLDDPAATAEVMDGGWLRTGDLGWIGGDGYVRIAGRAKDMVIVGGFNVYPAEVENVLADHPGVLEAAVVGVPDERLGEVVVGFVVPRPDVPEPGTLVQWCRERLANFKVPRQVWIVGSLPRGPVGKVAKPELRARAITLLGSPGDGGQHVAAGTRRGSASRLRSLPSWSLHYYKDSLPVI